MPAAPDHQMIMHRDLESFGGGGNFAGQVNIGA
jgi:hypothetical protein